MIQRAAVTPEVALRDLLLSMFTAPELRGWLRFGDRARSGVLDTLPGEVASSAELCSALVTALIHRGLVKEELFLALIEARGHRADDIQGVAALWGLALSAERVTAARSTITNPLSQLNRADLVEALEELLVEREHLTRGGNFPVDMAERIDELVRRIMNGYRPKEGDIVAGARLRKPIGNGNFGTIWLAQGPDGTEWAVKVFHLEKLAEGVMLWRFRRSIRAMSRLTEDRRTPPHIVRLFQVEADTLAFSMPFLPGRNLENIDRRGWSLQAKLDRFLEICRAVEFAHRLGIVHRDIKPANVVIDGDGRPVLTDFDISDIKFATRLSTAGGLGTPIFAAPEQLQEGDRADERSDVYSLGRLLHYLLLERSPGFQVERDPSLDNLSAFPAALVAVVRRACQWDPENRHASVMKLICDVEQCQSGIAALQAHLRRALRWTKYNWALLFIAALVSGGSFGGFLMQRQIAQEQATNAIQQQEIARQKSEYAAKLASLMQKIEQLQDQIDESEQAISSLDAQADILRGLLARREADAEMLLPGSPEREAIEAEIATKRARLVEVEASLRAEGDALAEYKLRLKETRTEVQGIEPPTNSPTSAVPPESDQSGPVIPRDKAPPPVQPGRTRTLRGSGVPISFVSLPGGRFTMGRPEGETGYSDELPQHDVTLSPFYMGKSEVTQTQWRTVVEAARARGDEDASHLSLSPAHFRGAALPVEQVSWCDAARFANALSRLEGLQAVYSVLADCDAAGDVRWDPSANGVRLPTEAEWEYAARAGASTAYATGATEPDLFQLGWYLSNSSGTTHPICTAKTKPWGLCDMHGNVAEWTFDWYDAYSSAALTSPTGPQSGSQRVVRGGGYKDRPSAVRSDVRNTLPPSSSRDGLGFRLAAFTLP